MHPTRWGDPAAATALPETARGLVELAFGLEDSPAVEEPALPAPTLDPAVVDALREALGDAHVLADDATRRLRTRGKSTPTCSAPAPATWQTLPTSSSAPAPPTMSRPC